MGSEKKIRGSHVTHFLEIITASIWGKMSYIVLYFGALFKTSNSNHRLKTAVVHVNLYVEEKGLVWMNSSLEKEARFLNQNDVNLCDRETKWPPISICPSCILHRHPNANTKLDLMSPIVDRDYCWLIISQKMPGYSQFSF